MKKLSIILILIIFIIPASSISEIDLNTIKKPSGAILFIVDGLGSSYYYPEFTPYALDGSELLKSKTRNLSFGARILDIKTPEPITGIAHSIIVTGYSKAEEEKVGNPDATIFDITREHGFLNIAVMEKGDFSNMRYEQDIIIYAPNNSINKPEMLIYSKNPPSDIYAIFEEWKGKTSLYINNKSDIEKYYYYNKWGIDAANSIASEMIKKHPDKKFLLTVNIGAADSGGHYRGDDDYVMIIEAIDRDFYSLYKTASENNIALFFTADHGMSFATKNSQRGGHSSKYASTQESLRIPLVILSPNAKSGTISGQYSQADIAPTLLSILDLPNNLRYGNGKSINIKNYGSIFVKADTKYHVTLWNGEKKIGESTDTELIFKGLELNTSYTLKAEADGKKTYQEAIFLDSDKHFNFKSTIETSENSNAVTSSENSPISNKGILAIILIIIVNIVGFMIIKRIK